MNEPNQTDEQLCSHARTALSNVNAILKEIQNRDIEFDATRHTVPRMVSKEFQTDEIQLTFKKVIK